jgi:hypothetical protein
MKITVIKKSNDKVKAAVIAACPWILDDPAAPKK